MTPEQRSTVVDALAPYGARLEGDTIARGDKVLGVRLEIRKGRLRAIAICRACNGKGQVATGLTGPRESPDMIYSTCSTCNGTENLLASFPARDLAAGVASFVERFWFWTPEKVVNESRP